MKLKTAHVTDFRCVEDSGEFKLDQVTCLVGKNESGKTTLLQALYRLNPVVAEKAVFNRDEDYPRRHLSDYDERHTSGTADAIVTKWELDDDDRGALRELLGPTADNMRVVTVYKGYMPNGHLRIGPDVTIDEAAVVQHILSRSELFDEERAPFAAETNIDALRAAVAKAGQPSPRHASLTTVLARFPAPPAANSPQPSPATQVPSGEWRSATQAAIKLIAERMPKFVYFSQYHKMAGRIPLGNLRERVQAKQTIAEHEQTFLDFCALANATLDELATIAQFEKLVARFEGASNKITNQIFKYWSQNKKLRVMFTRNAALAQDTPPFNTGEIFNVRIWNDLHQSSVPFDERSAGFVWFFSFLVYFSQIKKTHGQRLIILLDEPGLTLHARAQGDLLRYIDEQLAPHHQVVYTTHSPFMIPADLMRARTVEDVWHEQDDDITVEGTKVGDDVLSTDRDTVFPLQGALGYEITQTLFVGKNTLAVEGPSDILYMQAFSEALRLAGRPHLDRRWTMCPVGGADKIAAFVSLFGGNKLNIAVVIDFASGQKRKVEDLRRNELLRGGRVLTAEAYAGQPEADIEDVIGAANYVSLVNACYNLTGAQAVQVPVSGATVRIVKHVEDHFRTLPTSAPEFDHFAPSRYLIEHSTSVLPDLPGALERYERLFADLNVLLPKAI